MKPSAFLQDCHKYRYFVFCYTFPSYNEGTLSPWYDVRVWAELNTFPIKKDFTIFLGCNFVIDINTDSNLQWMMAMITMHHQLCGNPGPQGHRGRIGGWQRKKLSLRPFWCWWWLTNIMAMLRMLWTPMPITAGCGYQCMALENKGVSSKCSNDHWEEIFWWKSKAPFVLLNHFYRTKVRS